MRRRTLLSLAAAAAIVGVVSALVSSPLVSARCAEQFLDGYAAVSPGNTTRIVLSAGDVGRLPMPSDLAGEPAEQGQGRLALLLKRSTIVLPMRESAAPFPRAWVFCESRAVGPFLLITELDGSWELARAAHVVHERTLNIAFAHWSYPLISWSTGAAYHGIDRD